MTASDMQTLFEAGAHFGYDRARRHPTASPFLFATKDHTDMFDLAETEKRLAAAGDFVAALSQSGKSLLMVGGKNEVLEVVRSAAERANTPFVAGRWIGGTLTNFKNIRKRIDRLAQLIKDRDEGMHAKKYTKLEQLKLEREIEELEARFGGLTQLSDLPGALFVVDTRHEDVAVHEANQLGIPVIGLANSDCDFSRLQYPIPANDTSIKSVRLIVDTVANRYRDGKRAPAAA